MRENYGEEMKYGGGKKMSEGMGQENLIKKEEG